MEIGKVPNDVLKEIILNKISNRRPEVLIRPRIGEDCSALDFGNDACVLSTDPITGAVNEVGRLAVHISCNDIASCGVEPIGLMVTILAPPEATESDLETIMSQITETANSINVEVIGGHTEVTNAVSRFVLISTAVGKVLKEKLVATSGAQPGDYIIITKSAGIEGTAIIAHDKEEELIKKFGIEFIKRAKSFVENVSVVKEGILAGKFGVNSMHDVTEGGVLGAAWEIAEASEAGVVIYEDKIPVEPETKKIAEFYGIDPLKLISSGCMMITAKDGNGLVSMLGQHNIKSSVIGRVTSEKCKKLVLSTGIKEINQPETDDLYKVVG